MRLTAAPGSFTLPALSAWPVESFLAATKKRNNMTSMSKRTVSKAAQAYIEKAIPQAPKLEPKNKPVALKQILKDAFKSDELEQHLTDVIAVDEKCAVDDLTDKLIVNEAKYVLDKFVGNGGFEQAEDYAGDNGQEQKAWAKKNVSAIRKFLKKYEPLLVTSQQ
jgi:hypothetical protein